MKKPAKYLLFFNPSMSKYKVVMYMNYSGINNKEKLIGDFAQ